MTHGHDHIQVLGATRCPACRLPFRSPRDLVVAVPPVDVAWSKFLDELRCPICLAHLPRGTGLRTKRLIARRIYGAPAARNARDRAQGKEYA